MLRYVGQGNQLQQHVSNRAYDMDILQFKNELNFEFTDDNDLMQKLRKFYTADGYTPEITIDGDIIHIKIDEKAFRTVQRDFEKAMDLCNRHEFDKGEKLLKEIITRCPLHVDAQRVYAQLAMERGDLDLAFDRNIEALRIDPTNLFALLLMGNICTRQNNTDLAEQYYDKVIEYHPDDVMAQNNLAANYLKRQNFDKAIEMFKKILEKNDDYLNTYYGLGMAYYYKKQLKEAFDITVQGMRKGVDRPQDRQIRDEIQKLAMQVARELTKDKDYSIEIGQQLKKLETMGTKPIRVDYNAKNLPVSARLEYSAAHHRDYEKVLVNPDKKYHDHLMMHELTHLELYLMAKAEGRNQLAMSGATQTDAFRKWIAADLHNLRKQLSNEGVEQLVSQLHNGLMVQALNSPLDLYVEQMIYDNYPEMRPLQMLSLVDLHLENIQSVTRAASTAIPSKVLSANRTMNVVSALQLHEMYGFNLAPHFKATRKEMELAKDLYEEWKAYFFDTETKPGDEYELLEYFTQHLGVDEFFSMVNEMHFNDISLPDKSDLPAESTDPDVNREQNESFQETHKDGADPVETMMMSMYMLGALKELKPMPQSNVHRIALEIAMVGMTGINPKNKGYKINALPGREFGGYEFLAYYYVSWAIAIPEKVNDLGLPFRNAYQAALDMYNAQNEK